MEKSGRKPPFFEEICGGFLDFLRFPKNLARFLSGKNELSRCFKKRIKFFLFKISPFLSLGKHRERNLLSHSSPPVFLFAGIRVYSGNNIWRGIEINFRRIKSTFDSDLK